MAASQQADEVPARLEAVRQSLHTVAGTVLFIGSTYPSEPLSVARRRIFANRMEGKKSLSRLGVPVAEWKGKEESIRAISKRHPGGPRPCPLGVAVAWSLRGPLWRAAPTRSGCLCCPLELYLTPNPGTVRCEEGRH